MPEIRSNLYKIQFNEIDSLLKLTYFVEILVVSESAFDPQILLNLLN